MKRCAAPDCYIGISPEKVYCRKHQEIHDLKSQLTEARERVRALEKVISELSTSDKDLIKQARRDALEIAAKICNPLDECCDCCCCKRGKNNAECIRALIKE